MIQDIMKSIGDLYLKTGLINAIFRIYGTSVTILKTTTLIAGLITTRKFKPAKHNHKYGICIAARNEEKVIGNLLDSIKLQDYPSKLIKVFVVADNCTDKTAEIARSKGAIVYERFHDTDKTKGFALKYLFENIEKDYKTSSFDGYFIFDADNLLKKNYITKMNDAFDEGCKIITSYRNTKNFDENIISSTYALHWLRSIRWNHRGRSVLRLATNIQGTGFLFSNEIVKNGWKYTSLTEDRALTADAVAQGYQITYQNDAMFYDEQPTSLKVAYKQRLRWSRGHLEAFAETGPYLLVNVFFGKLFLKTRWNQDKKKEKKESLPKRIIESIRHRIASYDTLVQLVPISFINLVKWLIISIFIYSFYTYYNGLNEVSLFGKNKILNFFFGRKITMDPGINALITGLSVMVLLKIISRIKSYFSDMAMAIYVFFAERKKIKPFSLKKKILYIITFPLFNIMGRITTYIAIFKKVSWERIPHESKVTIKDLEKD